MLPVSQLLPLPSTIPLEIPTRQMKKITLAYAARQESTSSTVPIACSCKKGSQSTRCQCKKHKQKCSIACHEEGIDCGNLSSLATRTEKGQAKHSGKRRRANTARKRVDWHNDTEGEEEEGRRIEQEELHRLRESRGSAPPLWTLEPDLAGMSRARASFTPKVQSSMRLRSRILNAQEQGQDKEMRP